MSKGIRPKALAVLLHNNRILVQEYRHYINNEPFYRPIGGKIELGEDSKTTLKREIMEEIDTHLEDIKFWTIVENIYDYKDKTGHELLFLYKADLVNKELYSTDEITGYEKDRTLTIKWIPLSSFFSGKLTLYPPELLRIITENEKIPIDIVQSIQV